MLGSILGSPYYGNYHIGFPKKGIPLGSSSTKGYAVWGLDFRPLSMEIP